MHICSIGVFLKTDIKYVLEIASDLK